jgi:hypothetical protein
MKWEVLVQKIHLGSVFIEAPTGKEAMSLACDKMTELLNDDTLWDEAALEVVMADLAPTDTPKE